MILYKYRSLAEADLEHTLDIILNQRLHCSTYDKLNDPFEGLFITTIYITLRKLKKIKHHLPLFLNLSKLPIKIEKIKEAKDLGPFDGTINKYKICSLSYWMSDVRLWSYYADGHKGIVFKIDFSGLETRSDSKIIHRIDYSKKLPVGRTTLLEQSSPSEVLSCKTKHWWFEKEYRIIDESKYLEQGKYFNIKGRIKAIYLGTRTSDPHRKSLNKIVPSEIPIYTTKINEKTIKVERGEGIPERKMSS